LLKKSIWTPAQTKRIPEPADGLEAVQPSQIMGTVRTVIMVVQKESGSGSKCRVHQAGNPDIHSSAKCASH
jgi:hypothetical protein